MARRPLRDLQRRHYAAWLDEPIPALDGQSPGQASRTAPGRRRLDLKDMENRERRAEGGFDFSGIRRTLRLE